MDELSTSINPALHCFHGDMRRRLN
ncbi:hypothetical protein NPIL_535221, partial [Nephila pilipes]